MAESSLKHAASRIQSSRIKNILEQFHEESVESFGQDAGETTLDASDVEGLQDR